MAVKLEDGLLVVLIKPPRVLSNVSTTLALSIERSADLTAAVHGYAERNGDLP